MWCSCCYSHRVGCLMRQVVYLWSFNPSAVISTSCCLWRRMLQLRSYFTEPPKPVTLTKQANVDLLQGVNAAELVEFVVNLVEYQSFVIVCGEVLHYVVNCRGENETSNKYKHGTAQYRLMQMLALGRLQMGQEVNREDKKRFLFCWTLM